MFKIYNTINHSNQNKNANYKTNKNQNKQPSIYTNPVTAYNKNNTKQSKTNKHTEPQKA